MAATWPTAAGTYDPKTRRITGGDIRVWLMGQENKDFPHHKIATGVFTNDYKTPSPTELQTWHEVIRQVRAANWIKACELAKQVGYEGIEYLDQPTGITFHILREIHDPGQPEFRGQGLFVFDFSADSNPNLILETPHVIFDSLTLAEGALALIELRPRALITAGADRRNATVETSCSGQLSRTEPYRISDPAHSFESFFHVTHEELESLTPRTHIIQFHGSAGANTPDVIVSNGVYADPPETEFGKRLARRIDAMAVTLSSKESTRTCLAAVYGESTKQLGAGTNVQGRFTNGVKCPDCCTTSATTANGRFVHIEQLIDVRRDPRFVIQAIADTLHACNLAVRKDSVKN